MIALLLAAVSTISSACDQNYSETTVAEEVTESVTSEELYSDTDLPSAQSATGSPVVMRAEVGEVIGETSFVLENNQLFSDEALLVIDVSDDPLMLSEEDTPEVLIIGEVEQLIIADFEDIYGLTLDPIVYADYEAQPIIVAKSIELSPNASDIASNLDLYYNQRIAMAGEVEEILSPTVFTIDEDALIYGKDLLVVTQNIATEVREGEDVAVTGVLRPYVYEELESYYDLEWDLELKKRIDSDYVERPVFVADEICPSAL